MSLKEVLETTTKVENTNCRPCKLEVGGVCTRPCPRNFIIRDSIPPQPKISVSSAGIVDPNHFDPVVRG